MPGVEPGSGSQTLKTSTRLAYLFKFASLLGGRRPVAKLSQVLYLTMSPENRHRKSLSLSTPFTARTGTSHKGWAAFLIKQPKHSCSWHLFFRRFYSPNGETGTCSFKCPWLPSKPHHPQISKNFFNTF